MGSFIPRNRFGRWLVYELLWAIGARRFATINVGFSPVEPAILAEPAYANEPKQIQLYSELAQFAGLTTQQWSVSRVLEVGCGAGLGLLYVSRNYRPARLNGIDYAVSGVARARAHGLDVSRGLAEALPFGDATFDCVFSVDSLNTFPPGFMQEAACVLAPKGCILIADFRLCPAPETQAFLTATAASCGLRLSQFVIRTSAVVRALEEDHDRKAALLPPLPSRIKAALGETLSLRGSTRWRQWHNGERIYYFAKLERAD